MVRVVMRAGLLALVPCLLVAQGTDRAAGAVGAFSASVGVATGSTSFSCDACESRRDNSVSVLFQGGVRVRPRLVVGGEANVWRSDYRDSRGTGTAQVVFGGVVAQWYPMESQFFLKGGAGAAWTRDDLTPSQSGNIRVTAAGPAFTVGAGWDLPLGRRLWATPYLDIISALGSDQMVNGLRTSDSLGSSTIQLGLALTRR